MTRKDKRPADAAPAADTTGSPQAGAPLRQGSGGQAGPALRQRAEAAFREKAAQSPEQPEAQSPEATRLMLHELRVHQIELEMQNEELRRAQAKLDALRTRYFDLYDLAPVGYCTVSETGLILQANLTAATLLGVAKGALVKQPISRFILKEDQDNFYLRCKQLFASSEPQSWELRMVNKVDGTPFWVQLAATTAQDEGGVPMCRIVLSDVTAHKLLEIQSEHERGVLEFLASGRPLPDVLAYLVLSYEALFPGMRGSVLLLDPAGRHLQHGAAPSLPPAFCQAIDGVEIGPSVGSCGTAAHTGKITMVADIARDPLRVDFKDLALAHGLRACWSVPIPGAAGRVLGTFTFYFNVPRAALPSELATIERGAYLASLAIERHRAEAALQDSEERYRAMVEWTPEAIAVHRDGKIIYVNPAAIRMLGARSAQDLVGKPIVDVMHSDFHQIQQERVKNIRDNISAAAMAELKMLKLDGTVIDAEVQGTSIAYDGEPAIHVTMRDITQHRQNVEEIRRLAFYDSLTGLPNRRLLMDRLKQAVVTSGRTGQHGALMFLDLDHFKQVNDTLGHSVGDMLLQQVSTRLKARVREGDSVARLGGDEFVVLLEALSIHDHEAAAQAEVIANKILEVLGQAYSLGGHTYTSTLSIGIALFMQDHETMDDLLKKADLAMYQARAAGRNTARFFDPAMQAAAVAHAELEKDLRRGLAQHEFVLHYQIQVDGDGASTGAEALVRWNHAKRGMVLPAHFIPLAEKTGMILALGQWVLETACAQLGEWARQPKAVRRTMAVNVSAFQFAQANFVASVATALEKTGANPCLLKLELTESMLVDDVEDIIVKMNALKAYGVAFALDDFGIGYSSLSRLKRLPLDQLKIDQSFVRGILTDPNDAVIARTVVALGHSMGLKVIAEGVETADQRDFLTGIGCDAFQGYYFGRPAPADPPAGIDNNPPFRSMSVSDVHRSPASGPLLD